jgi:Zn finger protein HypA/HybF involved in hydrogenase expression
MVTYVYIVKCPNCEDEHFDFFNDAKEFARGCLTKKPIITQVEVCRNDFGECTDSCDLGTVWSWDEVMKDTEGGYIDTEPAKSIFTKDDLKLMADGKDPEFDALDNSVDFEPEISDISNTDEASRKPIPEGMTIEQLVEEMEENEDTVECTWCNDLFDKSECRKEVDLGWLCSRCEAAIKSRGETLTFSENNYWDFLDEELETKIWICSFEGKEIGTVEAATEEDALEEMQRKYPEYPYGKCDGCFEVYPAETSEVSDSHLKLCPECGKETFDIETGICVDCGFN